MSVSSFFFFFIGRNVTIRTANPSSEVGQNNCTRKDRYKQGTLPYRDAAKDSARLDYEREDRAVVPADSIQA